MKAVATITFDAVEGSEEILREALTCALYTHPDNQGTHVHNIKVVNVSPLRKADHPLLMPPHMMVSGSTLYSLADSGRGLENQISAFVQVNRKYLPSSYTEEVAARLVWSWNALRTVPLTDIQGSDVSVIPPELPYTKVLEQRDQARSFLKELVDSGSLPAEQHSLCVSQLNLWSEN